jgi:uncharacterized protein YbjT (DUF2867 family)
VAVIDPLDIAPVAAKALLAGTHNQQTYRLSGAILLWPAQRVAILANTLARPLRFQALTDEQARAQMSAQMSPDYVDAFFSFYADGTLDESTPLPTVGQILGRQPRAFAQWTQAHRSAFPALRLGVPQ